MKGSDVAELTDDELERKARDLKAELFNLRFQKATGQLDNPMRLREVRRDVARVLTIQRLRELQRGQTEASAGTGRTARGGAATAKGGGRNGGRKRQAGKA